MMITVARDNSESRPLTKEWQTSFPQKKHGCQRKFQRQVSPLDKLKQLARKTKAHLTKK